MSERYQIVIKAGSRKYHFKTKTRVGNVDNFCDEMKNYVDWVGMVETLSQKTIESNTYPKDKTEEGDVGVVDNNQKYIVKCIKPITGKKASLGSENYKTGDYIQYDGTPTKDPNCAAIYKNDDPTKEYMAFDFENTKECFIAVPIKTIEYNKA